VVTVGAMLSLTGRFAVQGEQACRGLRLWVEDVNAAGGLPVGERGGSSRIRLLVHDDQSRVGTAAALAEQLVVDERVDLLIGPYSSALALAVAPVAERHGRVLWNHGGSSDAIAEQGFRSIVNLLSPAGRYFDGLLDMLRVETPSARRVALLHGARGTFPRAVIAGTGIHAARLGFEIVLTAPYPPTEDGFRELIAQIAARQPDLILGVGTTEADLAFARALRVQDVPVSAIGLVATPIGQFGRAPVGAGRASCARCRTDLNAVHHTLPRSFRHRAGLPGCPGVRRRPGRRAVRRDRRHAARRLASAGRRHARPAYLLR
jgi:branched-chain amino acid transport system substrate-binding protein